MANAPLGLQKRPAFSGYAILCLLLGGFNSTQAYSANISCLISWRTVFDSAGANAFTQGLQKILLNEYPSGRIPSPSQCKSLLIQGEIEAGDYDNIRSVARQNFPFLESLYLNSPGGDANEAMRIGRLARHLMLVVTAPSINWRAGANGIRSDELPADLIAFDADPIKIICRGSRVSCGCASACVFIWAGGAIHSGDALGLHRPTFRGEKFKNMDPEYAQRAYQSAEEAIVGYLSEMEFPKDAINAMINTSSETVHWPTVDDLDDGLRDESPPSLAEWLNKACPGLSVEEHSELLSLAVQLETQNTLNHVQKDRLNELGKRSVDSLLCSYARFSRHRDFMKTPDQD